ncbi:hypothetical protein TBLA_0J01800 [Henningerozyma blattae CBS 6284]|uniref:Uncharacterized protein n=1 Tax=Henningerozyma blattae (strain ATCC 34711 / CBS 6284 / DSM 70876 / NBRC 10599 / NRRL Y-10934 / UCD 77-7) TaxID=1071380 RepID=I2H9X2_HENB6|nr:hypothetical protein TBLA_0J01800 [Tetrapisispora blattae CBS 6284]CCH63174.1 hypothetical protein TBLA_0J01800 [Tetrapisispora blattae CBS 6284]
MSFAKIAAIIAAAAAIAKADREAAMISMEVYMNDIGSHMKDYLSMEKAHPEQSIPPGVLSAYAAKLTDKTDSYTSFFADIGDEQIHYMITGVPWYSTRLAPAISQALEAAGLGEAAPATSSPRLLKPLLPRLLKPLLPRLLKPLLPRLLKPLLPRLLKPLPPRLLKPLLPRLKNLPRPLKPLPRLNLLLLLQMLRPPKLLLMLSLKSLMVKFKLPLNNKLKTVLLELLPV